MDRTRIILLLYTHRWIGPKFLLPENWFSEDGSRLTLQIKASETNLQLMNIAFVRQDYLQLLTNAQAPEVYRPAICPAKRMVDRLDAEFRKNRLWERYRFISASDRGDQSQQKH